VTLPPGQRAVEGFPRFGTHLADPPPEVPAAPAIEIAGAGVEPFALPLSDLGDLPRIERTADFHCVAGWSATGLRWEGVGFATFFRRVIEPALAPGTTVTHLTFQGLDGYRTAAALEDVLSDDVLIAEGLDGAPLAPDHGAPVRLVSPAQYGFMSAKHLCRIELHTAEPREGQHPSLVRRVGLHLVESHPRARVWGEERHRHLPPWAVRRFYRTLIAPIRMLSARGSRPG